MRGALATKQSIASPKEEGKLDCFVTSDSLETEDLKGESVQPFIEDLTSGLATAIGQALGDTVENTGVLGPPGDAARQSPAAMAGRP